MLSYLESYAEHFNLLPKIKFNTMITSVSFAPKETDGVRFNIKYKTRTNQSYGEETELTVDRVIVCTGFHSQPFTPTVDGMEYLKGETLHSASFRT